MLAKPALLTERLADPSFQLFQGLENVDIAKLVAVIVDPQGNVTYEQIGCVGLNPRTTELVATIDVKLSSGYSGGLCTAGSYEYVAFWVDVDGREQTSYDVPLWIEEEVVLHGFDPPTLAVHSANSAARRRMEHALKVDREECRWKSVVTETCRNEHAPRRRVGREGSEG